MHFLLEVEGDVAEFFLDVANDFSLGGGCKGITTLSKNLCKDRKYGISDVVSDCLPRKEGWKSASGQRKRSLPMVIT